MDGATLLDSVREQRRTELDRLGSEKALLAATEARLEPDAVLGTAAATLGDVHETVEEWARASDEPVASALWTAAERLGEAHERVTAELRATTGENEEDAMASHEADASEETPLLALEADGDVERLAAATIGAGLVLDRRCLQSVSFFVNEADTARADLFRDLRGMADDLLTEGQDALEKRCRDSEDWERATGAVTGVIDVAYADYVERLDAMGFDPKPIC